MVGDFNAKLGKDVIGGDVHPMSPNGKLLFSLCNKYNLFILNSSNLCKGVFTRIHNYRNKVEKSVLEYVLVSADLYSQFVSMHIDEEKLCHIGINFLIKFANFTIQISIPLSGKLFASLCFQGSPT